ALLGCKDGDGNYFIVDEHVQKSWIPERHASAIKAMLDRHNVTPTKPMQNPEPSDIPMMQYTLVRNASGLHELRRIESQDRSLSRFVAGTDVFSKQSNGSTIANEYINFGIRFTPANTERVSGWAQILNRLGDPDAGIPPKLFIHERCRRLLECIPALQHDPNQPEDVLKVDVDEDGAGGDDTADALRYMIATKPRIIYECKLTS
ncbi:MAG TPA: hypothetical protein VMZ27_08290, partial [Candidatus Saccharimonadales bacterium]|nr:hypothetical protein [Candidatus Saccharimonadales bacterium]